MTIAVLVWLSAPATAQDVETRSFTGEGSRAADSDIELYLIEGAYQHRIRSRDCLVTVGIFPAQREPMVRLGDVLQADLAVGTPPGRVGPIGAFRITRPGWATVQLGTGPECGWTYEIVGRFLPPGREPGPPGVLTQPWVLWVAVVLGAIVAWRLVRRPPRRRTDDAGPERVRVVDPDE